MDEAGVDGSMILTWIFKMWDGGVDCIDLVRIRTGDGFLWMRWWIFDVP